MKDVKEIKESTEALLIPKTMKGTSAVSSVALGSDNDTLVSGGGDNTIYVWSLSKGVYQRELKGHADSVLSVALGSDNDTLVSGGGDNTIRVWSLLTGACKSELRGHTEFVNSVALGNDNDTVVSGSWDKTVRVWSLSTGTCQHELKDHTSAVNSVTLCSDNDTLVSGGDNTIRVWSLTKGTCQLELKGHTNTILSVTVGSDSDTVVSGSSDKTVRVWSLSKGTCLKTLAFDTAVWGVSHFIKVNQLYVIAACGDNNLYFQHALTLPQPKAHGQALLNPQSNSILNATASSTAANTASAAVVTATTTASHFQLEVQSGAAHFANTSTVAQVLYTLQFSDLNFGNVLGEGSFGIVYQGTWRHTPVAIKQLHLSKYNKESAEEFRKEAEVMAKLPSPDVVRFYGYCESPKYCLVMEYLPKGSLHDILHNETTKLDWTLRLRMVFEMARGLAFLHAENIIHRDIKSHNILVDEQNHVKLADFGLATVKMQTRTQTQTKSGKGGGGGTLAWMAPELFKPKATHSKKSDVYSLGMTFWEIAARKDPYEDIAAAALIPFNVEKGEREEIPADCPPKLGSLITFCWHKEIEKRPSASEIVEYLESDRQTYQPAVTTASATAAAPATAVAMAPAAITTTAALQNDNLSLSSTGVKK
jgi:predicted Ser/Thr protein kinase